MSKREIIAQKIDGLPDQELDRLLMWLRSGKGASDEQSVAALGAETVLARDWLSPEEHAAWANL